MTEPLIRPATADDAPSLAGLIGQLGYAVTAAEVAERLGVPRRAVYERAQTLKEDG